MNYFDVSFIKNGNRVSGNRIVYGAVVLLVAVCLSACGSKEKKAGQALARVNGDEITMLQVNDELRREGIEAEQQEVASRRILESLIERQLILEEAMRNKIHRTPEVMQAIENAKAKIIEQAYLERAAAHIAKPSLAEINEYYEQNPEYFSQRKQLVIQQLIIATRDINDKLKQVIDTAKSLPEVADWMEKHHVRYVHGQLSRSTTDLPEQIVAKLKDLQKGQLFIVKEGENSLLNSITDIKNSPITLKNATPQIEAFLINKKTNEVEKAEISHLRSLAKIEYLNEPAPAKK